MKNFNRKKAEQYIVNRIKTLEKQGLNIGNILRDKGTEYFAYSQKRLKEFKHNVQFEKERPWRERTIKNYEERVAKRQAKKHKHEHTHKNKKEPTIPPKPKRKDIITDSTKAIMIHNYEDKEINRVSISEITKNKLEVYLKKRYFKSTSANYELNKRLDALIERFGARLDLANEFIEDTSKLSFKYEIEGIVFDKDTYKTDYAESWDLMMENRLIEFENLLKEDKYNL